MIFFVKHNKRIKKTLQSVNILQVIWCFLWEVGVGQFKRVQRGVALVVPKQLVFQKLDGFQSEDDCFMFQHAVDIQTWQRTDTKHRFTSTEA